MVQVFRPVAALVLAAALLGVEPIASSTAVVGTAGDAQAECPADRTLSAFSRSSYTPDAVAALGSTLFFAADAAGARLNDPLA